MKYLTKEQMEKLPTPRLLAYFKKHLRSVPIWEYGERKSVGALASWEQEWSDKWEQARKDAKEVLATRPHSEKTAKKKKK